MGKNILQGISVTSALYCLYVTVHPNTERLDAVGKIKWTFITVRELERILVVNIWKFMLQ